ncbi:hypothetical protein ACO0QE_003152 [Hanseniaspora vineae]
MTKIPTQDELLGKNDNDFDKKEKFDLKVMNLQGRPITLKMHVHLVAFPTLNDLILHFQSLGNTFTASTTETRAQYTHELMRKLEGNESLSRNEILRKENSNLNSFMPNEQELESFKSLVSRKKVFFKMYSKEKVDEYNAKNRAMGKIIPIETVLTLKDLIVLEKTFHKYDPNSCHLGSQNVIREELIDKNPSLSSVPSKSQEANNALKNGNDIPSTSSGYTTLYQHDQLQQEDQQPKTVPQSKEQTQKHHFSKHITVTSVFKNEPIFDKIIAHLPRTKTEFAHDSKLAFVKVYRKSKTNLTKLELVPIKKLNVQNDNMESIKKHICYPRYKHNTKLFIVGDVDYFATIFMDYNEFLEKIIWQNDSTLPYDLVGVIT